MYVDVEFAAEPPPAWPCWAMVDPGRSVMAPTPVVSRSQDTRHAGTSLATFGEAGLTVLMTAPLQYEGAVEAKTGGTPLGPPSTVPVLAHRMKHDKSILALAVSSQYIFAGTQGGEILVRHVKEQVHDVGTDYARYTASTRTSADESSTHTREASSDSACRKTRSCCSRVRQIRSSM